MGTGSESPELLLTAQEAAQHLSLSLSSLYRMLRQGKLEGKKQGSSWRITQKSLEQIPKNALADRLDPDQEQALAESGRCPVCTADLVQEPEEVDNSSWAHEFRECTECGFSFHEHAIDSPEDLHKLVAKHIAHLEKYVQAGRQASRALTRRRKL